MQPRQPALRHSFTGVIDGAAGAPAALPSAVDFRQVRYTYPEAATPALDQIDVQLPEGELIVVVGPSGAGKSTLLRLVNGLAPHFSGGHLQGSLRVLGLDPVVATPRLMSREVGFVFQDPENQFVMDRVEDEIAFALENAGMARQEMRIRVEETLDLLDLAPLRGRRLDMLSGGERQRVAIAAALALRPRILVLDEPTSQLDPKSAEDVLAALVRLNTDLGLTVLLAEHRLERVLPYADRVLYLPQEGAPRLDTPRALLGDEPAATTIPVALSPPLVRLAKTLGWEPLPLTVKEGLAWSRQLRVPTARGAQPPVAADTQPILSTHNLHAGYGDCPVLHGTDFAVRGGEIVVLLGRNGSGKTTLLKSLVGLIRPQRGEVRLQGVSIKGKDVADICRQVGYLPQDPNQLLFADTVAEEMAITLRNHGYDPRGYDLPIAPQTLLERLGLAHKAHAYPRDMSVGERQRAALAAILVTRPQALLLDEPTRGLDYAAKARLRSLLEEWRGEGMGIVIVTHDVELAAEVADRVVLMSQGEIIADGDPYTILGSSPLFASQVARLFPGTGWLTVEDALDYFRGQTHAPYATDDYPDEGA
ncbi:MAG: ATP-binding cassette domain-containing protein [Litorilinea sp.]